MPRKQLDNNPNRIASAAYARGGFFVITQLLSHENGSDMKGWLWILAGVLASMVSWTYMHRILLPWEDFVNVQQGQVKAQMGDLYPRWVGTRELLLHGRNPYGPEVSHEIQMAFYGRAIEQSYDKPRFEIIDEQRFVYPLYVVFLLAPSVHGDFAQIQMWAPLLFGALTAISLWLWMKVLGWHPRALGAAGMAMLVLSSPQVAQGLRLRQLGLFVAFLVALAAWCISRERYAIAGMLLAISTIKPQMVALVVLWFLLWSFGDWTKRWPLATGFGASFVSLAAGAEWLLPGWPRFFLAGLAAYAKYFPTTSPVRLILGNWIGGALSVLALAVLLGFAWRMRNAGANSRDFAYTLTMFFVANALLMPLLTPYNQVFLLLPVLMLLRDWKTLPRLGRAAMIALLGWPWIAQAVLLMHPPQIHSQNRLPLLPSALLVLFPFLVGGLAITHRSECLRGGLKNEHILTAETAEDGR